MNRIKIILFMMGLLFISVISIKVNADTMSGYYGGEGDGTNVQWKFEDGVLTFSGKGVANGDLSNLPWKNSDSGAALPVKKIVIEEGITYADGLDTLPLLEEIVLPSSMEKAPFFGGCPSLTQVTIPEGVVDISGSFRNCTSLKEVSLPSTIEKVDYGFEECKELQRIELPENIHSLSHAFSGCESLEEVVMRGTKNLVEGEKAFSDCKKLKRIVMQDSLTSIYPDMFNNCESLEEISLGNSINKIPGGAFLNCKSINNIDFLPDSVSIIGGAAFSGCESLTEINIPSGVTSIGEESFSGCKRIKKVYIGDNVKTIGYGAFWGCERLEEIRLPNTITKIEGSTFRECKRLKEIVIPDSVKTIEELAFSGCVMLEKVDLNNVEEIDLSQTFCGCKKLKTIDLSNVKKLIYGQYGTSLFGGCEELEEVILPDSITEIPYGMFEDCRSLREVKIPSGVVAIGDYAFSGCWNYKYILPEQLEKIGNGAFRGCGVDIREVVIPETVTFLGKKAFSVDRIVLPEGFKDLDYDKDLFESSIVYCSNAEQITCCKQMGFRYIDGTESRDIGNEKLGFKTTSNIHTGKEITPEIEVTYSVGDKNIVLKEGFDYEIEYSDNVKLGKGKVLVKGINFWEGQLQGEFDIYAYVNSGDIQLSSNRMLYDGSEKRPTVSLKYDGKTLSQDIDYTVAYANNIEEGQASVTIKGIGNFKGEVTKTFEIYKYDLGKSSIELPYSEVLYDGSEKKPEAVVKYDGNTLVKDKDYTISYTSNIEVGQATVTVQGKGRCKGTKTVTFNIYKYDFVKSEVGLSFSEILCDGSAKEPEVTVTYDGKALIKDKDYTITFINNIMPGLATVSVSGINQYSGTVEKNFEIKGISLEPADVSLKESIYSYDGSPKTPSVEVKLNGKTLLMDTDYLLTYENNIDDGTAHAVVTGTGMYIDVVKVSFVILPYNPGMDAVYPEGTLIDGNFAYGVTDDENNEVEAFCPSSNTLKSVQIPATITDENGTEYKVTSVGNKAFYKNTKITSVTIGNNVKSIEDYAFYGCKNIKTLKIGKGVEIIGNSAFRKCTKLTSVTLPKSIDSLGKNVFYGCSKLKTITINANSVVDIKANAIKGISKAVIKVPKKLVKKYEKEFDKKSGFMRSMKVKKK